MVAPPLRTADLGSLEAVRRRGSLAALDTPCGLNTGAGFTRSAAAARTATGCDWRSGSTAPMKSMAKPEMNATRPRTNAAVERLLRSSLVGCDEARVAVM